MLEIYGCLPAWVTKEVMWGALAINAGADHLAKLVVWGALGLTAGAMSYGISFMGCAGPQCRVGRVLSY